MTGPARPEPATPPQPGAQPGPTQFGPSLNDPGQNDLRQHGARRRGRVRLASTGVASVLAVRMWLAAAGAVLACAVAVWLYFQSMSTSLWGPYLPDGKQIEIVRYSTGFLVGAAGALLVGGLLLTAAVADAVRRSRLRRATRPGPTSRQTPGADGWAAGSTSSAATLSP